LTTQPAGVHAAGRRALIGSGLVIALAVGAANALNVVFQFGLGRILHPSEYSLVVALFTIVLIAAQPTIAFQAVVAREVANRLARDDRSGAGEVLGGTLRAAGVWTAVVVAGSAAIAWPVASLFDVGALPLLATGATIGAALAIPVAWGALQATGQFVALSVSQVAFAGLRLAAGLAIGLAGGNAGEVMLGVAAATAVGVLVSLVPLRPLLAAAGGAARRRLATLANAGAAAALTASMALSTDDLLVAKLSFSSHRAGVYSAASVGSRVLLLAGIAVVTVLFPKVAVLRNAQSERRHLLAGLGAVALVAVPAMILLFALAEPLLRLTFGRGYTAGDAWLGPLSIAMALYALASIYLYHFLSLGRARFAVVLVAILGAQLAAYAVLHGRPRDLIGVQITTAAVTLAASELWHLRRHRA
jgi:O-antigen/teichoic acid export membrane protein